MLTVDFVETACKIGTSNNESKGRCGVAELLTQATPRSREVELGLDLSLDNQQQSGLFYFNETFVSLVFVGFTSSVVFIKIRGR